MKRTSHVPSHRRVVALVLAIGIVPLVVGGVYLQREAVQHAGESLDLSLVNAAGVEASTLGAYFERASTAGGLAASAPAFHEFYERSGSRRAKVRSSAARGPAEVLLGLLARLYPGSIGETCFIDRGGAENARVVRGRPVPVADLSPDETHAPFFNPAFALAAGQVYQSRPYVSPDTGEWVVSNSSPVLTADGVKRAIVHFEVTVESFRAAADRAAPDHEVLVVDRETGTVVLNSRRRQSRGERLVASVDRRYVAAVAAGDARGTVDVAGKRAAFTRVPRTASNANDWYVVVIAPPASAQLLSGAAVPFIAMAVILLLIGLRIARRENVIFKLFAERFERAGEERLDAVARHSSDVVTVVGAGGVIHVQTGATSEILGYRPGELLDTTFIDLVHPDDRALAERLLSAQAQAMDGPRRVEWRLRHGDGSWRHMETSVSDMTDDPHVAGAVLTSRDIGARKLMEDQLRHRAFHDPLTQLPNRALFYDRIEHALSRDRRSNRLVGVIFVDLDDFKLINDRFGHAGGDELLTGVAQRLRSALRSADTVARVGGDEFGVLLEDIDGKGEAEGTAERILAAFREPLTLHGETVFIRPSLGVAVGEPHATVVEDVLKRADIAMYAAKRGGKGCYQLFDEKLDGAALQSDAGAAAEEPDRLTWFVRGEKMREEIEAVLSRPGSIRTVFQPLVDLRTGAVAGYEALSRFDDPGRRPPNSWFAQATRCGLGAQLEARALEVALASAAGRPAGTYVSLNLSPSSLLSEPVERVLPDDLSGIVIEITENELLFGGDRLSTAIARLRGRGARIAIDDAGAGYAGLKHLMLLQPDIVKLDRGLIEGIGADPAKQALIDAFVRFSREIGASVCAEGIEELEDLVLLADLDVEIGQGYAIGRPAEEFAQALEPAARALRAATAEAQRFGCGGVRGRRTSPIAIWRSLPSGSAR